MARSVTNRIPFKLHAMLATLVAEPFDQPGWVYEEKYDGDRMLAYKQGTQVRLLSRNDIDNTHRFPGIVAAIAALAPRTILLDGEIVIFDRRRVSRFQLLQRGGGEPFYAVFDCLYTNGTDLRDEPLSKRRAVLEQSVHPKTPLLLSHRLASNGIEAYQIAKRSGYEGLVAKQLSSPYVQRRSRFWLKVKVHQEDEFVIVGYTAPEGGRKYFGALLLGAFERGELRYVGKVGTGFDSATLAALHRRFQPLLTTKTPLANPPRARAITYIRPRLVAQISYAELTADRKLRQAVYLGLRQDKRATEVTMPIPVAQ
jgi:bifunctional non-homologous end joining protein LigD